MVNSISILGSTGSIGRQTVAAALRTGVKVSAISGNKNLALLEEQARRLRPDTVCVYGEKEAADLRAKLRDTDIKVVSGMEGLIEISTLQEADCVVTAVSGSIGLKPTLAAIKEGKRIALANKETLVCAGDIVMAQAKEHGAEIIPVDSEHSAIFQSLHGGRRSELRRILLTASGGPFLGLSFEEVYNKTPADALKHPNWSMGAKITRDSATMMNKGLEFIEAMHLFSVTPDQIEVLIHPQSAVHSAVEFCDGSIIAQLGVPDMGIPIQYALTYPNRAPGGARPLSLTELGTLSFSAPDLGAFKCLALAMDCAKRGGTAPCIMSAANEMAVGLFLQEKISFGKIYECVKSAVDSIKIIDDPTLGDILDADAAAREFVLKDIC